MSDDERHPPLYIDIRVTFKEVYKEQIWPDDDTFDGWDELEPHSISRLKAETLTDGEMRDMVEKIMESNNRETFINGLLASLHGQETTLD